MTLDLTCQACDASFELDLAELLDEPRIQCPSCDARTSTAVAEGLSSALDELLGQVARMRRRFQAVLEVDSEDLPPPYDRGRMRTLADEDTEPEEDVEPDEDEALGRDAED
jgi:hypothetical protein